MRALVLGGSVFVGKCLVETLVAGGHHVTVLNRGLTPATWPAGVEHIVADRTDTQSMRAALADTAAPESAWDAVFDVSGFVMAAGGSDIAALLDLLDGRIGHYVYVSSIMAYDQSLLGVFPWTEDMATNPEGARSYGGFKAATEQAMLDRHAATGFPVSIVRPAAIYGPDNNIFDMETPLFIRLCQRRPILVPHSGLVVASYGHVNDLCDLMMAIVGNPSAMGQVFNITAEAVTVNRYVETLAAIVGVEPHVVTIPDDMLTSIGAPVFGHLFTRSHHAALSIDKAQRLLGFAPRHDFRSGHEHTYAWFLRQGWAGRVEPLSDEVWRATWNFDAEDEMAARIVARAEVSR